MNSVSAILQKNDRAFTLVEILVVLVIVGILAAVAIPRYTAIVADSRSSEAKVILNQIIQLETAYYYKTQTYVSFDNEDVPDIHFVLPVNSKFDFKFEDNGDGSGIATATENTDINGDGDTLDGLTLDTANTTGSLDDGGGSILHW